jgi:long-subunit acyl-CoA synthetase (AMP-forming)
MINQIYVDVNTNYNFLVAIVHLDQAKLNQFAEVNGLPKDPQKLITMQEVEYGVLRQIEQSANHNKVDYHERIANIHITSEEFTQKNNMLTKTQKLKRQEIKNYYSTILNGLYTDHFNQIKN